jgi:hypothetical protein
MTEGQISFRANRPITLSVDETVEEAQEGDVFMWDEASAQYVPEQPFDRLLVHDTTGSGDFELVFASDGSPLWY